MQCGIVVRQVDTSADDIKITIPPECSTCLTDSLGSNPSLVVIVPQPAWKLLCSESSTTVDVTWRFSVFATSLFLPVDVYYVDYEATLHLIGSIRGQQQVQWMTWMGFLPLAPKAWFPTTGNVTQRTATQHTIPQCNAMPYTNKTVTQRNVRQRNTM